MTIPAEIDDSDWEAAFAFAGSPHRCAGSTCSVAPFDQEDVESIISLAWGENGLESWIGVFKLKDGRFAFLSAWCDNTGWDCRSGGSAWVADDLETLIQFGLGAADRARLELSL